MCPPPPPLTRGALWGLTCPGTGLGCQASSLGRSRHGTLMPAGPCPPDPVLRDEDPPYLEDDDEGQPCCQDGPEVLGDVILVLRPRGLPVVLVPAEGGRDQGGSAAGIRAPAGGCAAPESATGQPPPGAQPGFGGTPQTGRPRRTARPCPCRSGLAGTHCGLGGARGGRGKRRPREETPKAQPRARRPSGEGSPIPIRGPQDVTQSQQGLPG